MRPIGIFSLCILLYPMISWAQTFNNKTDNQTFRTKDTLLYTTLSSEEFESLLKNKLVQLIDVRTPEEYAAGFIPYAVNMDIRSDSFEQKSNVLCIQLPVAVYCKGGIRSRKAASILTQKGYTVYNLDKGFDDWVQAGKRVLKPDSIPANNI